MSNGLERSFGDKNEFALLLRFEPDPDNGIGATKEEAASWGAFELWVKGRNLCEHIEESYILSDVHWYLLPLLEWFVENWDPLLHEQRLCVKNAGEDSWTSLRRTSFARERLGVEQSDEWIEEWQQWWLRHNLQAASEGGLFPDVFVRRWQDTIEISWGVSEHPGCPPQFRFLGGTGRERVDPVKVAGPLYEAVSAGVDYLLETLPESARLLELKEGLKSISQTPVENRLAWLAGLGRSFEEILAGWRRVAQRFEDASDAVKTAVLGVAANDLVVTGSCQAGLMFGSMSPTVADADVIRLAGELVDLYTESQETAELRELVKAEPIDSGRERPYDQGYRLAEEVLETLGLFFPDEGPVDVGPLLDRMGIERREIELTDDHVRGVAVAGPHHKPAILYNRNDPHNRTDEGLRFTLAHEFCHILFDRDRGRQLALASGLWAPRDIERRAGAFAAMFLMPADLVRGAVSRLDVPIASEEGVDRIRGELGTSFKATLDHLFNLGWVAEDEREQILDQREQRLDEEGLRRASER